MTEQQKISRHKICEWCGVEYCDIQKRNSSKCCSLKCASTKMANTRKQNGSYKRTKEQNDKMASTFKRKREAGEIKPLSKEVRQRLSASMKRSWAEGKISSENHWTKTEEGKRWLSQKYSNRVFSEKALKNMSLGQQKRIRTKKDTLHSSAKGGIRKDLGVYFRSNWEANYARILNYQGKQWEYEPKSFPLKSGGSYTPDFEVEGVYVELKGRIHDYTTDKYNQFVREYNLPTLFIGPEEYKKLRDEFKHFISWEGK